MGVWYKQLLDATEKACMKKYKGIMYEWNYDASYFFILLPVMA
jgi:hypothetical protein